MGADHRQAGPGAFVKVCFALPRDDEGWPPVGSEGIWAEPLGDDRYRLDNTPWFVRDVSADDIVHAVAGDDGMLWATGRITWSGRLTVRVIPLTDGPLEDDLRAVLDAFADLGVSGEGAAPAFRIVALDIPAYADYPAILTRLRQGQASGRWEYEEGCVDQAWLDL